MQKSFVWKYFTREGDKARCKVEGCNALLTAKASTPLFYHLEKIHKILRPTSSSNSRKVSPSEHQSLTHQSEKNSTKFWSTNWTNDATPWLAVSPCTFSTKMLWVNRRQLCTRSSWNQNSQFSNLLPTYWSGSSKVKPARRCRALTNKMIRDNLRWVSKTRWNKQSGNNGGRRFRQKNRAQERLPCKNASARTTHITREARCSKSYSSLYAAFHQLLRKVNEISRWVEFSLRNYDHDCLQSMSTCWVFWRASSSTSVEFSVLQKSITRTLLFP